MKTAALLLMLTIALATAPAAMAQSVPRSVVSIREVDIRPTGVPRYAIEIVVNGAPMLAGLDTGSTGLRLLPRAAARARIAPGGTSETYNYSGGVTLIGRQAAAGVTIGGARGQVVLQAIDRVGCTDQKPRCPATRVSPADYGLMGSGQPGQGFPAIIGVRLEPGRVANPLPVIGVHRWIVHLPERGRGEGALVLNPDARDTAGFVPLHAGAPNARGTVAGCVGLAMQAEQLCGPTLFDTGAPGLGVLDARRPQAWQPGRRARLTLTSAGGRPSPAVGFLTGDRDHGAETTFNPDRGDQTIIHAGTLPFYAYDVLFDADTNIISVRPNPEAESAVVPLAR